MEALTRILELASKKNMTANAVAVKCGLQSNSFTKWKSGTQKPSLEALTKIADYFNVSLDFLVGREQKIFSNIQAELNYEIEKANEHVRIITLEFIKKLNTGREQKETEKAKKMTS